MCARGNGHDAEDNPYCGSNRGVDVTLTLRLSKPTRPKLLSILNHRSASPSAESRRDSPRTSALLFGAAQIREGRSEVWNSRLCRPRAAKRPLDAGVERPQASTQDRDRQRLGCGRLRRM